MPKVKKLEIEAPWRPTREQLAAAANKTLPDILAPGMKLLLVGINPGLYTAAIGHHFGRPGNRFWPAMYAGGLTPRLLSPFESGLLADYGIGITNMVSRATARADELTREELQQGAKKLERKVRRYKPRFVALLGLTSYREAFSRPKARLGRQPEKIGDAVLWLLPNPSGLNAHHQPRHLAQMFNELREAIEQDGRRK